MKTRAVVILLIFVLASVVQAGELMIFSRHGRGVYLVQDGEERRIIYRHGTHIAPKLSPDGWKVLFHSKRDGKSSIWVMDLKGGTPEKICYGDQAEWSPDGEKIVFRRNGRIIERELASGAERTVSPKGWSSCEFPSYMPDGRVILVRENRIFIIDPDGNVPPDLVGEGEIRSTPKSSPDGKRVAYQDGAHIYLVELDTKAVSQLTMAGGVQSHPVWSSDGQSICYLQSPDGLTGPWDIYHVRIDSPGEVRLIARDVERFDWIGAMPPASAIVKLKGTDLDLHETENGWEVENGWFTLRISKGKEGPLILPKGDDRGIKLAMLDDRGNPVAEVESVSPLGGDGRSFAFKLTLFSRDMKRMETIIAIFGATPAVMVKSAENVKGVYVERDISYALIPDGFADDLIFDPSAYLPGELTLPCSPLTLGLIPNGGLLVVMPSEGGEVHLIKAETGDRFSKVAVIGGEVTVTPLIGKLWYRVEVKRNSGERWGAKWSRPFLARWKMAMAGKGIWYSRVWGEEDLNELNDGVFPVEGELGEFPRWAIIYLYDRSWHTPLDIFTPMDIMRDSLGLEGWKKAMDIEGLRSYRLGKRWLPLHDLLTSQDNRLWPRESPGWPKSLDLSPIFKLLGRVRMSDRKEVESTISHFCEDIVGLLEGLDERIREYKSFIAELRRFCRENRDKAEGFLDDLEGEMDDLEGDLKKVRVVEIGEVQTQVKRIKSFQGSRITLEWEEDIYDEFRRVINSALESRQEMLRRYRGFVKRVRDEAGTLVAEKPTLKGMAEDLRQLTKAILRNRYYLEGDWRGEEPL